MTATRADIAPFEHPIGPDGLLVVRLRSGDVRLRGTAANLATIRARGGRSLDALDIEAGDRSLSVGAGRHSADLDIEVPTGASIVVEAESADLMGQDLHGDQRFRTGSGDVTLRDVTGTLAVEAVSGDVEVSAIGSATVALRTVSGDVSLTAATLLGLEIATTSGEIEIAGRFEGDGPFQVESISGDTRLSPVNDVRVEMDTISGDLSSRLEAHREDRPGRRVLVVGMGGPTITARSTSGDVRVDHERVVLALKGRPEPPARPGPPSLDTAEPRDVADVTTGEDLEILRALERGDIDTTEAGRRLADLDERSATEHADA